MTWTSVLCHHRAAPQHWGEVVCGNLIRLKDTGGTFWDNKLVSSSEFLYNYPSTEVGFVAEMRRLLRKEPHARVHLFYRKGSNTEFFGEWTVEEDKPVDAKRRQLLLRRSGAQSERVVEQYALQGASGKRKRVERSHNEKVHGEYLRTHVFPETEWLVRHEPETLHLVDAHSPSVVDGAYHTDPCFGEYTCDFVVSHRQGLARVCVESKPCVEFVDNMAIAKARKLRDLTFTRVVVMAGSGVNDLRWLDLGPPLAPPDQEVWCDSTAEFRARMGLHDTGDACLIRGARPPPPSPLRGDGPG